MQTQCFSFIDPEDVSIYVYHWSPDAGVPVCGVIQIAHGMAETAARYERFAKDLTQAGYEVYANDHRGHGKTAKSLAELGQIGADGYNWMVRNLNQLNHLIHQKHGPLPVFLFGHSMGSFLARKYMSLFGTSVNGVILSGTGGKQSPLLRLAVSLAQREQKKHGAEAKSPTLNRLLFRSYNRTFSPARTEFDWLSRDVNEVDLYIADPYCGQILSTGFYYHFLRGLMELQRSSVLQGIPRNLPVLLLSGSEDPVGNYGKGVLQLVQTYRSAQLTDVQYKLYPGGRHEMLNEVNRQEVVADILAWLATHASR